MPSFEGGEETLPRVESGQIQQLRSPLSRVGAERPLSPGAMGNSPWSTRSVGMQEAPMTPLTGMSRPPSGSLYSPALRFHSRSVGTLQLFSSLSSPYNRQEARLEKQTTYITLRDPSLNGSSLVEMAALKLQQWYRLEFPRKRLRRRLACRNLVQSILYDIVNDAFRRGSRQRTYRLALMQDGAARCIQSFFRKHYLEKSKFVNVIKKAWARKRRRKAFANVLMVTRTALRVYRWYRGWHQRHRPNVMFRVQCKRFVRNFFLSIGAHVMEKQRKTRLLAQEKIMAMSRQYSIEYTSKYGASRSGAKNKIIASLNNKAATRIQGRWRGFMTRKDVTRQLDIIRAQKILVKNLRTYRRRHNVSNLIDQRRAARMIQRLVRGFLSRLELFRRVRASVIVVTAWRRYKASTNLRQNLRRIERPLIVTLKNIKNLPPRFFSGGESILIKVSIWWHPLLHIVSEEDFDGIMKNKPPQLLYSTPTVTSYRVGSRSTLEGKTGLSLKKMFRLKKTSSSVDLEAEDGGSILADFDDLTINVPGCHGNSVLQFDFFSQSRKFASAKTFLGNFGSLLFWKIDLDLPVQSVESRRGIRIERGAHLPSRSSAIDKRKSVGMPDAPLLSIHLASGTPLKTKAQWGVLSFRGHGPAKRKMRKKILTSAIFDHWDRMFLSCTGELLHIFENKYTVDQFFTLRTADITSVRSEVGTKVKIENSRSPQDNMNVVVSTVDGDEIFIRFYEPKVRHHWKAFLEIFEQENLKRPRPKLTRESSGVLSKFPSFSK